MELLMSAGRTVCWHCHKVPCGGLAVPLIRAGRKTCAVGLSGVPLGSAEGGCIEATQDNFANQLPRRRKISAPRASGDVHRGEAITKLLRSRSPCLPSSSESLSFAAFLPPPPDIPSLPNPLPGPTPRPLPSLEVHSPKSLC